MSRLHKSAALLAATAGFASLAAVAAPAASAATASQARMSAHQLHVHHVNHLNHTAGGDRAQGATGTASAASAAVRHGGLAVSAPVSAGGARGAAQAMVPAGQWAAFDAIISHESGWNPQAVNASSGAYGLAQALPGSKMASVGSDWKTNAGTQIKWALSYMNDRYGSPNAAWSFWQTHHWY
ncbi:transglycosylase SLT domain-containing protein [Peterkaempfera bronchialis]|uniref:aggregation-promoting factor C-terminal-like domain-containing protein n=1 Tax=Peterkaempfera bronchialis TaxID=2126346 RepID=UPI003C2CE3AD